MQEHYVGFRMLEGLKNQHLNQRTGMVFDLEIKNLDNPKIS